MKKHLFGTKQNGLKQSTISYLLSNLTHNAFLAPDLGDVFSIPA